MLSESCPEKRTFQDIHANSIDPDQRPDQGSLFADKDNSTQYMLYRLQKEAFS